MSVIWADEAGSLDAPLIVLIHGSMDRSAGMLRLSRRLDDSFRVLRYDRRGYGRSSATDNGWDRYDMGAQVADLVSLLGGRRAILMGHSYGGNVAMATAARHADLVAALALYEVPLSWEPWWPGTTAGSEARATSGDAADAAERFMRRLISDQVWESLPEGTRVARRSEGPAMVGELRDLQADRPWVVDDIRCPVVLSYGSNGAEHHRQGMRFLHEQIPGSTCIVLEGCRHDAPMSHSQRFASLVIGAAARAAGDPWAEAFSRSVAHQS